MTTRLVQHGEGLALVIDEPMLAMLNISVDTPLELTTNGDQIVISPIRDEARRAKLDESIEKLNAQFGDDLRRLGINR